MLFGFASDSDSTIDKLNMYYFQVKFEVMKGAAISGMLDKDGKSARAKGVGTFKVVLILNLTTNIKYINIQQI